MLGQGRSRMFSRLGVASMLAGVACGQAVPDGRNGGGSGGNAAQPGASTSGGVTADGGVPPTVSGGITGNGGVSGSGGADVELRGGSAGSGGLPSTGGGGKQTAEGGGMPIGGADGPTSVTCATAGAETELRGCLVDAAGKASTTFGKTPVTVVKVGEAGNDSSTACGYVPLATRIQVRAADAREWTYYVQIPGRPLDQVQVGDELDLSVTAPQSQPFFDQTVVLGRGSELVLFTSVSWSWHAPDLSAYDTNISLGSARCITSRPFCGIADNFLLLVTQGAERGVFLGDGPIKVGKLVFTVGQLLHDRNSQCDPPSSYTYGIFLPR